MRKNDSLGLPNRRRLFLRSATGRRGSGLLALLTLMLPWALVDAAQLKEARVSQIIKDVKLLPAQAAPRPAAVRDEVREGTAVRTGIESRAELTFTDQTLARLGANTIFSFNQGTRNLDLGGGAMLLRVPKDAGGAQINTAAVTAAITGTTVMLEYHPNAFIKFIILEGTGRVFRKGHLGESVLLHAGQMLIVNPNGKGLPDPVDVDLDRLMKTSLLIIGFDPLPSGDLIAQAISSQDSSKNNGGLIETNLVIFGSGTTVALLDPTHTGILDQANSNEVRQSTPTPTPNTPTPPPMTPTPPPITPTPTPSKSGTPTVIASSTPYQIGSGTTIQTDPAITTNGRTDFGKIYSGPGTDGSISTYLFTATSAFDQAIQFDQRFQVVDLLPLAVFKFSALQLTGNPTISLTNGGAPNLALISVGDITSGGPGGTLTFAGLNSLILATQDGSITLSSALAFQGIPSLGIYARGADSNLTLDATISGTTNLFLGAEGNLLFNNPLNLTQTTKGVPLGLFTVVITGGDLIGGGDFTILNDNSVTGDLSSGASVVLQTGGNFTLNNGGNFSSTILNNGGGHIGVGGDIFVSAGGNFTANSITVLINNRDGGTIDTGGNLTFNVGGALTTTGDASLVFSNRDDGGGGGTAGSGFVSLGAGSVDIGGTLTEAISVSGGGAGSSLGLATAVIGVSADLVTGGGLDFSIQNGGMTDIGQTPGGIIDGDVLLSLSTGGSFSSGDFLTALITNLDGGQIGGNTTLIFGVGGDISVTNDALWQIINTSSAGLAGSTLGSDATITLTANNVTAGSLFSQISDTGGSTIGNDATLSFDATGAITTPGAATFRIVNFDDGAGNGGGTIGGNASVSIAAQSLSAASLLVRINNLGGTINGDASINFVVGGALVTTGNATFDILQDLTGGSVAGNSSVTVSAGSFNIGGTLLARISDLTTSVDFDNVTINAAGDITVGDQILVDGNLTAGGNISGANGITITGGSLIALGSITSTAGAITQNASSDGQIGIISAGGDIFATGSLNAFYFDTSITAGGSITASDIGAVTVVAGSNITIGEPLGSPHFIFADSFSAGGAISLINVGNIQSETSTATGGIGFTPDPFTLSALSISGAGPALPALLFDGEAPDPTLGNDNPGNGALVTLSLTGDGLTIGSAGDIASITASGGPFALDSTLGGNGGTINITATGDVNLLDGAITATSGAVPDISMILGNGGTVNITTAGAITVASKIEVSSNELEIQPTRRSATGGNISLTSNKTTAGAAITVSNSGQLLALLDQAAPGPGGKITILATGGGGSSVTVNGQVEADRGTVDIRHTGANGTVNVGGTTPTDAAFLAGDVVKVGALGNNGVLTVGQGFISANDTLKLYAASANGQVHFIDNVSIGGANFTLIAANTVTIDNSKVVTVNGARADVYTGFNGQGIPNANYTGSGGNGSTTGTFGGVGANNPQPIGNAPPFDGPPGG